MTETKQPYRVGDTVKCIGTEWQGNIRGTTPNFEGSGETASAVQMDEQSIKGGVLPVETVSSKLIEPCPMFSSEVVPRIVPSVKGDREGLPE